jgi:TnpA family transposase
LLTLLDIRSANQDTRLTEALAFVIAHRSTRRYLLPADIDISFLSHKWQTFVTTDENFDRRSLEVCVFMHVSNALACGDLYVEYSETYNDPRAQLLSWEECQSRLSDYCSGVGLADNPADFIARLKEQLARVSTKVDAGFPDNTELTIDSVGIPHLKRQAKASDPEELKAFQKTVRLRMPERHLLDILKNANHWARYTRHFGPPSGSDSKLLDAAMKYIFAVFGNGCFLGNSQTARHAPSPIDRQTLRRINAQHINSEKLEAGLKDLINEYARFQLPAHWGDGDAAITDGTHVELTENTLLGERHIRYGGYGGIAYHHIADNYIALFCSFIACGVWEAVYIFDGLLKNTSDIQPGTLHADTHGQSEPVFGLAYILGVKLFPRMRTWNDVKFYRPTKDTRYKHIDALFTDTIDWDLIERHWQDLMQIVLSIQAGKILPSLILRKLGSRNRKSKLYRAFRELGRVERTAFLLRYISEHDFRFSIRAETTKIESFHSFLDWIAFGGTVIKSGDPIEQAKRIKYMDIVANAIMLNNVVDLTAVLNEMTEEGIDVTPELIQCLSPYMREHILRFGKWMLDMDDEPPALQPELLIVAA